MTEYDVCLHIEGFDDEDDEMVRCLYEALEDAGVGSIDGDVTIDALVEADGPVEACLHLADRLALTFPGVRATRVDQDLVSIPDIARRTGRSRESVRLLADGRRGPGGFPFPAGVVGGGIAVWPWAVVLAWFRDVRGDAGEASDRRPGIPPLAAAKVDVILAERRACRAPAAV